MLGLSDFFLDRDIGELGLLALRSVGVWGFRLQA